MRPKIYRLLYDLWNLFDTVYFWFKDTGYQLEKVYIFFLFLCSIFLLDYKTLKKKFFFLSIWADELHILKFHILHELIWHL